MLWYQSVIVIYLSVSDSHSIFPSVCVSIYDSPGMLDGFNGLTEVVIYPTCITQLRRAVVLTFPVLGQIDAGWQATQLTHKQLKHTNSGCSR